MNKITKILLIWGCVFGLLIAFFGYYDNNSDNNVKNLPISSLVKEIENNRISNITISGYKISGQLQNKQVFVSYVHPLYQGFINDAIKHNTIVRVVPPEDSIWSIVSLILSWLPMMLIIAWWIMSIRNMRGGSGSAFGFGKSKAKAVMKKTNVTFKDVAGIEEAKQELSEIVQFLKHPDKFSKIGAKIPKGVILTGPPGTGKTLLAKAIAGEAEVPFLAVSGSDFVEMFVGVGASRVRDMFKQAKSQAPCIVFIDEIDAVGRKRGSGLGGGNDEREQTLNQILVEMDGFEANTGVVLIAATNRPEILDNALMRPGRLDRKVSVSLPDIKGREEIFKVHLQKVQLSSDIDPGKLAKMTRGFSGADISNVVNESAIFAAINEKLSVCMHDIEEALNKHWLGKERRSMIVSDKEKSITAYHEGAHALVAVLEEYTENPHTATIMPRSNGSLGHVLRMPSDDMHYNKTKNQLIADIRVALAGRLGEELIFGPDNITTGASSDMASAHNIAYMMVIQFGMSNLGMIFIDQERLGNLQTTLSEDLKKQIDAEIMNIINDETKYVRELLKANHDKLEALAKSLIEKETLTEKEILEITKDSLT